MSFLHLPTQTTQNTKKSQIFLKKTYIYLQKRKKMHDLPHFWGFFATQKFAYFQK